MNEAMTMNQQIAEHADKEIKEVWGGRLPTWEEYKRAKRDGRVRANKTVAAQVMDAEPIPKAFFILYSVISLWVGFLIFPATLVAWFFLRFNALWILGAVLAAWLLVKVSREGHCEGMKAGAVRDEDFYEFLVRSGAFLFGPAEP